MKRPAKWTDSQTRRLRAMWAAGKSAEHIGAALGRTESAIENKAYMLGITGGRNVGKGLRKSLRLPVPPLPGCLEDAPSAPRQAVVVGPAKRCQFIFGEKPNRMFCGDHSVPGYSFCQKHKALCYEAPRPPLPAPMSAF